MSFRNYLRPLKVRLRSLQAIGIKRIRPRVLRTLPHDSEAFTQGLCLHRGSLYESTGLAGRSSLRVIDSDTGRVERQIALQEALGSTSVSHLDGNEDDSEEDRVNKAFAEGIAILNDRLYQLTWRSGIALRYSLPALEPVDTLPLTGQGWGLASDGNHLVLSNGSSLIEFRDAELGLVKSVRITANGLPFGLINDLAVHNGKLYFNVYRHPWIYVADMESGRVERVLDLADIAREEARILPAGVEPRRDVMLNGIAIDSPKGLAYVTGKLWSHYYVISLGEADHPTVATT